MNSDYFQVKRDNPTVAPSPFGGMQCQAGIPADKKPSNTEQAMKSLEGASSRLEALVGELERRISPVLLPEAPQGQQGDCRPNGSPLADKMFNEESRLRSIAERLDSIISRVDL